MEAKDTMMTDKELMVILEQHGYTSEKMAIVRKAQAEISFPLGKQEGIRKVVEWINSKPVFMQHPGLGIKTPIQVVPEWQAKLKEWGINESNP